MKNYNNNQDYWISKRVLSIFFTKTSILLSLSQNIVTKLQLFHLTMTSSTGIGLYLSPSNKNSNEKKKGMNNDDNEEEQLA